jgi:hypothetical protein
MSTLKTILEKYKQNAEDEQRFMEKHTENVSVMDGPGVAEIEKAVKGHTYASRKEQRAGYDAGDDESVYESTETFSIEDIKAVLSSEEIDEDIINRIESHLVEGSPSYFLNIIDGAIETFREEATDEERELIDEMTSTEEGYQELVDLIFEEDDDEDDDDEDEDDEDDDDDDKEVIKKKEKPSFLQKEKYKK